MNWIKDIKNKTWIDWVKIVVAIDIASVGIGLIIGFNFHVLAGILGFISRILFGIMYVFVAVLIIKRVFPNETNAIDNNSNEENIDFDIKKGVKESKRLGKKLIKKVEDISEKIIDKVDHNLDKAEDFLKKKKKEAKDEVNNLLKK